MSRPGSGYTPKMAANMFGNNAQLMSGAQQAQAQNGQPVGEIIADVSILATGEQNAGADISTRGLLSSH